MPEAHEPSEVFKDFRRKVKPRHITLGVIVALVVAYVTLDRWYTIRYDERYLKRSEGFLLDQAEKLKVQLNELQKSSQQQSTQLDELFDKFGCIEVQSAMTMVAALQENYDAHLRKGEQTVDWAIERDRLKRQLDSAELYRDKLLDDRSKCIMLSRW